MTTHDTIILRPDSGPDVRFRGQLVAEASSFDPAKGSDRWTELRLYQSDSGRWIAHELGRSQVAGERNLSQVYVCDDAGSVFAALGTGPLAKELYDRAGLECVIDV